MIFKSDTMNINFKDAVGYLTFKEFEKHNFINHAFSTRVGGVSNNEFKSLNLSFSRGDDEKLVRENYKIFCDALNFDPNLMVRTIQVHGNTIKKISKEDVADKNFKLQVFDGTDGFITNEPGIVLTTFHADCPAVFMIDPVKKAIGLAHAGWRGTVKKISKSLVEALVDNYNSSKNDILCALGPSIGKCCFEVSKSILPEFEKLGIKDSYVTESENKDKINIDLLEVNRQIVLKASLPKENIFKSDVCTMCNSDLLFSHRATNGKRGNNGAFISIIK